MKSLHLAALAAALVLGACSSATPTDPALLDSATPSFDGGVGTMGSGGDSTEDGGGSLGSGNGVANTDSTGTQRGGGSLGSGN